MTDTLIAHTCGGRTDGYGGFTCIVCGKYEKGASGIAASLETREVAEIKQAIPEASDHFREVKEMVPGTLNQLFSEIWEKLEKAKRSIYRGYTHDSIKQDLSDIHALCRPFWDELTAKPLVASSEIRDDSSELMRFWKKEYESLAESGVEMLAEHGIIVDPATKMIEAAEYREKKFLEQLEYARPQVPKRESGCEYGSNTPVDASALGRIDGVGNKHPKGSYVRLVIGGREYSISEGAAEVLANELLGSIGKNVFPDTDILIRLDAAFKDIQSRSLWAHAEIASITKIEDGK